MLNIRVLLVENCPSLSHRSTLTFQVGVRDDEVLVFRLVANTAKGRFSDDWMAWPDVAQLLQAEEALTCSTLQPLFAGKSINTGGFMLAVLRHLGLVQAGAEGSRAYVVADAAAFLARCGELVASNVSLGLEARPGSGKGRRKAIAMATIDGAALDL
ncbi:hypothetical protein [Roseateles sp. LKC17W]|uniref:Uncharacterized protein n=1 Tax=Pelomonas margarita TaxID=3299031 RepID=A0ABW7FGG9_9BURK